MRSVKVFGQNLRPNLSVNIEKTVNASDTSNSVKTRKTITGVLSVFIEERIRANLEPLTAQISTLTQFLNELNHDNSVKTNPTAAPRTHPPQTERPLSKVS